MAYTTVRQITLSVNPAAGYKVTSGFTKTVVDYVASKGEVTSEAVVKRFAGKKDGAKKITTQRVVNYLYYLVRKGALVPAGTVEGDKSAVVAGREATHVDSEEQSAQLDS